MTRDGRNGEGDVQDLAAAGRRARFPGTVFSKCQLAPEKPGARHQQIPVRDQHDLVQYRIIGKDSGEVGPDAGRFAGSQRDP